MKRFPRLSETFILNEILELERQGVPVEIFSLMEPAEELTHGALKKVKSQVTYLPNSSHLRHLQIREREYMEGNFGERKFKEVLGCKGSIEASVLFLKAAALAGLAQSKGVKHLHAHFGTTPTTVAMLASRLSRIPYSFTAHARDIFHESVDVGQLKEKIAEARFVVTVSDYNRRYLVNLSGEKMASKIHRLYNGIDLTRFQPVASTHREPGLILAIGRLVEKKGFCHLIEACRLLKNWDRPFRCLIVGEGPERAALEQQISVLKLQDQVILEGALPQERVVEMLKRAFVFVLPCVTSKTGDQDALPTVLLESLAMGLPAISTNLVGIPEIVVHGETGFLAPPEDSTILAESINKVLANTKLQMRMGGEAVLKAWKDFDIRKNVPVLGDLFARSANCKESSSELSPDEVSIPFD